MTPTIINLQANDITVITSDDSAPVVFPSDGKLQVRMSTEDLTPNGLIKKGHWTYTRNLPEPTKDTIFIVSSLVAMFELYENDRRDLVFPWGMVRGDSGRVIACQALCSPRKRPAKG